MATQPASTRTTESPETPYPAPRYAWYVVGVLTLMYVFSFIDRQIFALIVGIPLGALSAVKRDKSVDYFSRITGLIGISVPNFWLATLLLIFTSRVLHWVPPLAYVSFFKNPWQNIQEFFLPGIAISVFTLAIVMRMVRATMLEVLNLDYVRTARAKGVPRRTVLVRHALRNALIPVVTVAGFEVGVLISGGNVDIERFCSLLAAL